MPQQPLGSDPCPKYSAMAILRGEGVGVVGSKPGSITSGVLNFFGGGALGGNKTYLCPRSLRLGGGDSGQGRCDRDCEFI